MKKLVSMLILSLGLSQVAFSAKTEVKAEADKTVATTAEKKTVLGLIKKYPAITTAIIAATVAAGTTGFVYFCPENSASKYIKGKAVSVKDAVVAFPGQVWEKTKAHPYIAGVSISAAVVSAIILGDLLRGDKSMLKKAFNKKAKENKEVPATIAA
jgi:hypothetical protein